MKKYQYALRSALITVVALVGLLSFAGCSDDPASSGKTIVITQAKAGSYYVYSYYELGKDSTKVSGSEAVDTTWVLKDDISIGGKNGVRMIQQTSDGITDTSYIAYEANGDMSVYFFQVLEDNSVIEKWLTVPFASNNKQEGTIFDGQIDFFGTMVQFKVTYTTEYTGTEKATVGTETVDVYNGTVSAKTQLASIVTTSNTYFQFAPSIGFVTSEISYDPGNQVSGVEGSGYVRTLTSYSLAQ